MPILPIVDPAKLPMIFDAKTDRGIPEQVLSYYDDRRRPVLRRELVPEERVALERRVADLRAALLPFPEGARRDLVGAISRMLASFPSMQRHGERDAALIATSYLHGCRERPAWAIARAADDLRHRDREFPPSEGTFDTAARALTFGFARTLDQLVEILDAKPERPSPPKLTAEEIAARRRAPGAV